MNSRLHTAEEKLSEPEDKTVRTMQSKTGRGKVLLKKQKSRTELWASWQRANTCVIVVPNGKGKVQKHYRNES